jgi:hypothetical protein
MGIEPTLSAWEAEVLPLNYTRKNSKAYFRLFLRPVNLANITFSRLAL